MAKKKFYAVVKGHTPGIYNNWADAEAQIKGFSGAKFKGFPSKEQAEAAMQYGWTDGKHSPNTKQSAARPESVHPNNTNTEYIADSISVDAACSGNPGVMEYQGVVTGTGAKVIQSKVYPAGTNNLGEFLAVVDALKYLSDRGDRHTVIYTDSVSAIAWVRRRQVKTMLPVTPETQELWDDINQAIQWLDTHPYDNPILKWQTKDWGESKADFGRK